MSWISGSDLKLIAFQFGQLKFADTIDLKMTFYLDLHKMGADGKLHNLTIHLNIKYNGTPDACSSLSAFREFIYDKLVAASIKYYVPRKLRHFKRLAVTRRMCVPEKCHRTVFWNGDSRKVRFGYSPSPTIFQTQIRFSLLQFKP